VPGEIVAGRRIPQIAAAIDLLPTLADLAGVPVASEKPLDGNSLKPLLTAPQGEHAATWPDRTLFNVWRNQISVRSQTHRLDSAGRLYDLETSSVFCPVYGCFTELLAVP
jgi:arylsulfatase A-like enzyme